MLKLEFNELALQHTTGIPMRINGAHVCEYFANFDEHVLISF